MDKKIRSMIDALFSQMRMTAENLALRDEMIANALARYEDNLAQGRSEEEALDEVAASLGGVQAMLDEIRAIDQEDDAGQQEEAQGEAASRQADLGDALGRAFAALGGFGQAIMPEAKKFVVQMDDASGGMLSKLGKATKKGLRDAQKAAEEAIDKLSGEAGELVFDFGAKLRREQAEPKEPQEEMMQEEAPQAEIKTETAEEAEDSPFVQPLVDENGDIDEAVFEQAVEDMAREAEEAIREAHEAAGGDAPIITGA